MPCGWQPEDCIPQHWLPLLDGHTEPETARAPCPLCGSKRALSIRVQGKRVAWKNHCECDKDDVRIKLAELLPGCVSARYTGRHRVDAGDLLKLADSGIPPQSLRLALYELAGLGTQTALDRMGVRRENRARVISGRRV